MAKTPVRYSPEIAAAICERLAAGESLRAICRTEGMPDESTVRHWAREEADFIPQYTRARELGYERMAEEIVEISDDGALDYIPGKDGPQFNSEHVQRSKLRVDTRKWLLSKMLPKVYGDKQQIEHSNPDGSLTMSPEERAAKLAALVEAAKQRKDLV